MATKIHPTKIKAGMRVRPAKETALYPASGTAHGASRLPTPAVIEALSDAKLADNGLVSVTILLNGKATPVRITNWDVEIA